MKRIILIVLDSLGVGAMPDAEAFGDSNNTHTLRHSLECFESTQSLKCLEELGLLAFQDNVISYHGPSLTAKLSEVSLGKDTVAGHWELMGVIRHEALPTYPDGFPKRVTNLVEKVFGVKPIGNVPISGTKIINELGEEHLRTGAPILYTSSDSVLQIAVHEEQLPVEELYSKCQQIRDELMTGPDRVDRIIARPFIGNKNGNFTRTSRRRDYTIPISENNLISDLLNAGHHVHALGKIQDIFPNIVFSSSVKLENNDAHMKELLNLIKANETGLIFVNLMDFDSFYGHRRDCGGYAEALLAFNNHLEEVLEELCEGDGLILTADHGCDPKSFGSDHTREYVPFIYYEKGTYFNGYQGIGRSFADCAATVAELFNLEWNDRPGISILKYH